MFEVSDKTGVYVTKNRQELKQLCDSCHILNCAFCAHKSLVDIVLKENSRIY